MPYILIEISSPSLKIALKKPFFIDIRKLIKKKHKNDSHERISSTKKYPIFALVIKNDLFVLP